MERLRDKQEQQYQEQTVGRWYKPESQQREGEMLFLYRSAIVFVKLPSNGTV